MRSLKRIGALLLALCLALSLAGCGKFETKMALAAKKMKDLDSFHVDASLPMEMTLSLLGEAMDLDVDLVGSADVVTDPLTVKADLNIEAMGDEINMLYYAENDPGHGGLALYGSADGGKTWSSENVRLEDVDTEEADPSDYIDLLLQCAATFKDMGREKINGSVATRFDGVISGEAIRQAMELSGGLESLAGALGLDPDDIQEEEIGDVPVSVWTDNRSGYIVRCEIDLSAAAGSLVEQLAATVLAASLSEAGMGDVGALSSLGIALDVEKISLSFELSQFDQIDEITIPPSARAA